MKIIYNKLIPFKGYWAITILNLIFIREELRYLDGTPAYNEMLNHESIHFEQEKELGFILFYIWYILEWLIKLIFFGKESYRHISFEQEAFKYDSDLNYKENRKRYTWLKYIFR